MPLTRWLKKQGTETLVAKAPADSSNALDWPLVTALGKGGYVIAWHEVNLNPANPAASLDRIHLQTFDNTGTKTGTEAVVERHAGSSAVPNWNQPLMGLAALKGGGFILDWREWLTDATGLPTMPIRSNIYDQTFTDTGVLGKPGNTVNVFLNQVSGKDVSGFYDLFQPVVSARHADAGYMIAWDVSAPNGNVDLWVRRVDADGRGLLKAVQVNDTPGTEAQAAIALMKDGATVVAWLGIENGVTKVYSAALDTSLNVISGQGKASGTAVVAYHAPTITALANGGYVITWDGDLPATAGKPAETTNIYAQQYSYNHSKNGGVFRINTSTDGVQGREHVTALTDGGFVVTWESSGGPTITDLYAQRFTANGSKLGGEILVNTTTSGVQIEPEVTQLTDGKLLFTWAGDGAQGRGIYSQAFTIQPPLPAPDANKVIHVNAADVIYGDDAFAGFAKGSVVKMNNTGSGDASYTFGALAEAAFVGQKVELHSGAGTASFNVDATGLSAGAAMNVYVTTALDKPAPVLHFTGGVESDTIHMDYFAWKAAGRTVDGGGGYNIIDVTGGTTFPRILDSDFTGIRNLTDFNVGGGASVTIGANAAAAFGANTVLVKALPGARLTLDGTAMTKGFIADGSSGADTFYGGSGNDTLHGYDGADLFILGQGGKDRIKDFTQGVDHIDLRAAGIHKLSDITQNPGNHEVVLTFAGQELRLENILVGSLKASDFIFAP